MISKQIGISFLFIKNYNIILNNLKMKLVNIFHQLVSNGITKPLT